MEKFDLKKGKMIRHPYDKSEVSLKKNARQLYILYIYVLREKRDFEEEVFKNLEL